MFIQLFIFLSDTRNSSFFKRLQSHLTVEQNETSDDEDVIRAQAQNSDMFQDNMPQSTQYTTTNLRYSELSHTPQYSLRPNHKAPRYLTEKMSNIFFQHATTYDS